MRNRQLLLSLCVLVAACDPPPSEPSSNLSIDSDCEVAVTFGSDAVQVSTCSNITSIDALYADGAQTSAEFTTREVSLAQTAGNPILSVWVDQVDGMGNELELRYDAPGLGALPADEEVDEDHDGVPNATDCDDNDPRVGALLYENDFSDDDGYLALGPTLHDPWGFDGEANTSDGGQQALLGQAETWTNTVTFGRLRISGIDLACGQNCAEDNTRFRAGFLARTTEDADQDEGFHGYRCAVARNSGEDCYDPGPFVQLAAFLDGPEDDYMSECNKGCPPNPTFDQLERVNRSEGTNFIDGDSGELAFWAVGARLVCEFKGNDDEHVFASAIDDRFDAGTTGLSTLNALANFDYVRVCEAFSTP